MRKFGRYRIIEKFSCSENVIYSGDSNEGLYVNTRRGELFIKKSSFHKYFSLFNGNSFECVSLIIKLPLSLNETRIQRKRMKSNMHYFRGISIPPTVTDIVQMKINLM